MLIDSAEWATPGLFKCLVELDSITASVLATIKFYGAAAFRFHQERKAVRTSLFLTMQPIDNGSLKGKVDVEDTNMFMYMCML